MRNGTILCPNCDQPVDGTYAATPGAVCPFCRVRFDVQRQAPAAGSSANLPPVVVTSATPAAPLAAPSAPQRTSQPAPQPATAVEVPAAFNLAADAAAPRSSSAAPAPIKRDGHSAARRNRGQMGPWEIVKVVLGGAAGLAIGYLVVFWIQSRKPPEPKQPRREQPEQVAVRFPKFPSSDKLPDFQPEPSYAPDFSQTPASAPPVASAPAVPGFNPPPIAFAPSTPGSGAAPLFGPRRNGKNQGAATAGSFPSSRTPATTTRADPPPVRRGPEALDGLPTAIELPSLLDTAAVKLCPLHLPAGTALELTLNVVAANIPPEASLVVERKSPSMTEWLCSYVPDVNGSAQDKKLLAEIQHSNGELSFQWRDPIEDTEARKELTNCILWLGCGEAAKTVALRTPREAPRLQIDLQKEVSAFQLPAIDPPKEDSLRLELAELIGFPGSPKFRDGKQVLKLKEKGAIEFAEYPGAEIQFEFRRHPDGQFEVVMRPEFRENAAERVSMTLPRLQNLQKSLEKAIPEGETKLKSLGVEARSLSDQLSRLGTRPAGGPAFAAWQTKRTALEGRLSTVRSQASRLERRLPEMRARLQAVPRMEQFLSNLQASGSVKVKVYGESGVARVEVVDARLDPPPQQSP